VTNAPMPNLGGLGVANGYVGLIPGRSAERSHSGTVSG
jgi:hypothetical protein